MFRLIPDYTLPSPARVLKAVIFQLPQLAGHAASTLSLSLAGLLAAVILSFVIAILMDLSPLIESVLYPVLVFSQTVPIIILAPLLIVWFGFGILPKLVIIFLVCFFPIAVNLFEGFKSVNPDQTELARSFGAKRFSIYRLIKIPASMVNLFAGLKIAVTYSIIGAVISEWTGGNSGLGVYMERVKFSFSVEKVFAVTFVIVFLSLLFFWCLRILEKILVPWNERKK